MTGKNVVLTTVVVLACFAAALVAYNYLDPSNISSFVQQSASRQGESVGLASDFEIEGKHNKHDKHDKHNNNNRNNHNNNHNKHNNGKHHGGQPKQHPKPGKNEPAPVRSSSGSCFTVNTASLNVRSTACGSAFTTLSSGTKVTAVGSASTVSGCSLGASLRWVQISSPVSGYVTDSYLVAATCDSTPTPAPSTGGDLLSLTQLRSCMPGASSSKTQSYLPYINSAMREGGITSPRRMAAFLAQVGHESGSLVYMEELASGSAYEGRKDLGNIYPGDGVKYKGRGPIQITGRANYDAAGKALGLDLVNNPTEAATPQVGFRLAVWFWNTHSLNTYADQNTQAAFDTITRRINGGLNGKADRDSRWATCKRVLGA